METNNTPVNIKEFKALIEKYESITLKDIKEKWIDRKHSVIIGHPTAILLTGFGRTMTCTLCIACEELCSNCVYKDVDINIGYGCCNGELAESYMNIKHSKTPRQLFDAYRNRAVVLRLFAKENNIDIE